MERRHIFYNVLYCNWRQTLQRTTRLNNKMSRCVLFTRSLTTRSCTFILRWLTGLVTFRFPDFNTIKFVARPKPSRLYQICMELTVRASVYTKHACQACLSWSIDCWLRGRPALDHAIIAVTVQQWRHHLTACVKPRLHQGNMLPAACCLLPSTKFMLHERVTCCLATCCRQHNVDGNMLLVLATCCRATWCKRGFKASCGLSERLQ